MKFNNAGMIFGDLQALDRYGDAEFVGEIAGSDPCLVTYLNDLQGNPTQIDNVVQTTDLTKGGFVDFGKPSWGVSSIPDLSFLDTLEGVTG